jgi:uncharacterized membrane protein
MATNRQAMSTSIGEALVAIVAVGTLPVGILTAIFAGIVPAAVVFVVGWLLLVPVLGILQDAISSSDHRVDVDDVVEQRMKEAVEPDESTAADPMEELRERYAAGELDDVEFERKVEKLLETEGVDVPPEVTIGEDGEMDATSAEEGTAGSQSREREAEFE